MKEAELYVPIPDGRVKCTACARHCQVAEGQIGLCGIRQNVGGKLQLLSYGKLFTGHIDPIEKKPVSHYKPGSRIFSVATSGCSWLCKYCFEPNTPILTNEGFVKIKDLFDGGGVVESSESDSASTPLTDLFTVTDKGRMRRVEAVFKHDYKGDLLRIIPYYLPAFECTPNHKILVTTDSHLRPEMERADRLSKGLYLAIPKLKKEVDENQFVDLADVLNSIRSSRNLTHQTEEHKGIPRFIKLDERLSWLLGIYCAVGNISQALDRPNSHDLTFTFGAFDSVIMTKTASVLHDLFGESVSVIVQGSAGRLVVRNSTLALILQGLAGKNSQEKKVPIHVLLSHSLPILSEFVSGYLAGDSGHTHSKTANHSILGSSSVSMELSMGMSYCLLRLQSFPKIFVSETSGSRSIMGREAHQSGDHPVQLLAESCDLNSNSINLNELPNLILQTEDFTLVPIRNIESVSYEGPVYNMQVSEDHTYSASLFAVSNCQNYDISQRRKIEGFEVAPEEVSRLAMNQACQGIAYTYNEPSIFIEFARDIGIEAHRKGMFNIFVSNGYDTPESVSLMDQFLDCITVDFKGSGETSFVRKYIGIPNADPIFDTLSEIKKRTKIHVEITDLIIPNVGDDLEHARKLSKWVHDNLGPETPMHFLRFHPDYKMMDFPSTPIATLEKHHKIAKEEGLEYAYIGNVPGHSLEHTYCPACKEIVVRRYGYDITGWNLDPNNKCKFCGYKITIEGRLSSTVNEERFLPASF